MDAQLITDNEDVPAKTFTLKRVVLIGLLMTLLTAAAVLFTLKDNLSATEEVSASAEGIDLVPPLPICQNVDRLNTIKNYCDKHQQNRNNKRNRQKSLPGNRYRYLLVDDVHRMLYCAVPGTGSSSIINLLDHYQPNQHHIRNKRPGDTQLSTNQYLKRLSDYSPKEIQIKMKDYYKFVLVRHPFVRLRSAYARMFLGGTMGLDRYWHVIKKAYTKLSRLPAVSRTINFYQFLELIIRNKSFQDAHWMTYHWMCLPCHVRYDAILKLETIQNDIQVVMDLLKATGNGSTPDYEVFWNINNFNKYHITNNIFKTVPSALKKALLKRYRIDLEMFGYTWDDEQGAECLVRTGKNRECC